MHKTVKIAAALHQKIKAQAALSDISVQELVADAVYAHLLLMKAAKSEKRTKQEGPCK